MSETLDHLAEWFDQLLSLPPAEREAALAALPIGENTRAKLARMLAADDDPGDPLASAISDAASLVEGSVDAGQRIGAYRILRELGSGGMGTVFLAERAEAGFEQRVAIKLMRGFPTEEGRARLRQERRILAELDHPHIARLLDGGETPGGQPYIVMEYVPGVYITDFFAQRRLDLRARLALFDEVLDAVAHAHSHLVIHRDLKPGNVLVREDGVPKLLDFGVAKLVDLSQGTTGDTSTRVWTPGYASPEQRAGRGVTTATDVFSLGVLLRELLTGERDAALPPLPADRRAPPLLLDADMRGIIAMATSADAQRRYATVEALRDDLRRYREGKPVRAARDTNWYRARKFVARHRVGVGLTLLALLGVIAFGWRLNTERERALAAEHAALVAGEQARQDAQTARKAMDFLVGVFSEADPEQARGRALTPRELVDRGVERAQHDAALDPLMRRALQRLFGALYYNMGEAQPAVDQLTAGLAGDPPTERAAAFEWAELADMLGQAHIRLFQFDRARAIAARADEVRRQVAPDDPRTRFLRLSQAGFIDYREGLNEKAIPQLAEAVKIGDGLPGLATVDFLDALRVLAHSQQRAGHFEEAYALSSDLIRRVQAQGSDQGVAMAAALHVHAVAAHNLGKFDEALTSFDRALTLRRAMDPTGATFSSLLNDYAILLNDLSRYRESLAMLDEAERVTRAMTGVRVDDPEIVGNIASVSESAGDYDRAERMTREAMILIAKARPDDADGMRRLRSNLGRVLAFRGRYDEARALLEATRREVEPLGPESFDYAFETFRLATAERLAGRFARASALIDEAERGFKAQVPEGHPVLAHVLRSRGYIAAAQGRFEDATRELDAARAILVAAFDEDNLDVRIVDVERAAVLAARGENDQARALLTVALPTLRRALLPTEVNRARAEALARKLGGIPEA